MSSKIILLIKIFDKEVYADNFLNYGEMFCRTLDEFKNDDDEQRGDVYEGVTDWHQPDGVLFTISYKDENGIENKFTLNDLAGPVVLQSNNFDKVNLYCMYGVVLPEFEENYNNEEERVLAVKRINSLLSDVTKLTDEVESIGQFAVLVYQPITFIDRVIAKAKEENLTCIRRSIKYYDPNTFNGSFKGLEAIFYKRDIYKHQKEHRFVFIPQMPIGNKTIHIGSLQDIAVKIRTADIKDQIKLEIKEDKTDT